MRPVYTAQLKAEPVPSGALAPEKCGGYRVLEIETLLSFDGFASEEQAGADPSVSQKENFVDEAMGDICLSMTVHNWISNQKVF
jgi:hypothetical protein